MERSSRRFKNIFNNGGSWRSKPSGATACDPVGYLRRASCNPARLCDCAPGNCAMVCQYWNVCIHFSSDLHFLLAMATYFLYMAVLLKPFLVRIRHIPDENIRRGVGDRGGFLLVLRGCGNLKDVSVFGRFQRQVPLHTRDDPGGVFDFGPDLHLGAILPAFDSYHRKDAQKRIIQRFPKDNTSNVGRSGEKSMTRLRSRAGSSLLGTVRSMKKSARRRSEIYTGTESSKVRKARDKRSLNSEGTPPVKAGESIFPKPLPWGSGPSLGDPVLPVSRRPRRRNSQSCDCSIDMRLQGAIPQFE